MDWDNECAITLKIERNAWRFSACVIVKVILTSVGLSEVKKVPSHSTTFLSEDQVLARRLGKSFSGFGIRPQSCLIRLAWLLQGVFTHVLNRNQRLDPLGVLAGGTRK
jgi:hypothetical protein